MSTTEDIFSPIEGGCFHAFDDAGRMDNIRRRFASNVRRLRRAKDISQEDFAERAGVHRTYISDVERGKRNPSITIVQQIADALDVSAGSLLD